MPKARFLVSSPATSLSIMWIHIGCIAWPISLGFWSSSAMATTTTMTAQQKSVPRPSYSALAVHILASDGSRNSGTRHNPLLDLSGDGVVHVTT
jgi:hypothetical protein